MDSVRCRKLRIWYESFSVDPLWKMIRRNIDRECDRDDVAEAVWLDFLDEIARHILPDEEVRSLADELWRRRGAPQGSPEEDWYEAERRLIDHLDPLRIIDDVIPPKRGMYVLQGNPLESNIPARVFRYMPLVDLMKYNFSLPISPEVNKTVGPNLRGQEKVAASINAGLIDSSWMIGSTFGRSDRPVWCTNQSLLRQHANGIRDTLGLKHVESGFLAEVSYSTDWLRNESNLLRPPTFLDACSSGAANWIFVKNRLPTGRGWGYTGKLADNTLALSEGAPEAVHGHFAVDDNAAAAIRLGATTDPVGRSAPQVDYTLTLGVTDL